MKRILLFFAVFIITREIFSQGCTVTGSIQRDTIFCGEPVLLSAFGQAQGIALLSENFNTGTYGPGWSATQQAMWNNPCSPNGVDGTTHIWMGNSSPVPRILTTTSFNLSSCVNAGVTICFDMLFATQGNAAPCEGPDEPQEGVYLQYSANGGSWTDIHYFDPNGGNDPQLVNWNNWCFPVPAAALTANTKFRWYQDADSGADFDHWGIDNVVIYCNDPTYNIVWTHDSYNLGPVGGTDPNPVAPHATTSYEVVMSNGTLSCKDTVTLVVINPTIVVNAGNDTAICPGTCAQLNATAKVVRRFAGSRTFANVQPEPVTSTFGSSTSVNVNVQGLNMTSIQANSILSVCIDQLSYFGFTFANPPTFDNPSALNVYLQCPDGTRILLVPQGAATPGNATYMIFGFPFQGPDSIGYQQTCFVPGGPSITTGNGTRHTGSYASDEPFNNLTGCTANGVWSIVVQPGSGLLANGSGTLTGWSITFDDTEDSYPGIFTWSPTTNMTNATTLTPTVCPPPNTYTITVSDTAGCVTKSDSVIVTSQSCCSLAALIAQVQPTCAGSNGSINVTPVPAGSYTFAWSDGPSTAQNRTSLPAGTYMVTITDINTPTCTWDTSITLNSNSTLNVAFSNPVDPTCSGNDGSITVTIARGTAPYSVTVDTNGVSVFTGIIPIAISQTFNNLPAGNVSLSVTDAQGCLASSNSTLTAPANCCTFTVSPAITQPACTLANGSISLTAASGSGNYSFNWGGGLGTGNSISNLTAGNYPVTITDNAYANCFIDTAFVLSNPNAPTIDNVVAIDATCVGINDGAITVSASGGSGALAISWSTGQTTFAITNLAPGSYIFTVTDAGGCYDTASATLNAGANCCTFSVNATISQPSCAQANGSIVLTAANGSGNYSYSWSGGLGTTNSVSNVAAGNYPVTITDNAYPNCFIDTIFALSDLNAPTIDNVVTTDETCVGTNDGAVTVSASGGTGVLAIAWSTGQTTFTITNLAGGNFDFTVTDASSCAATGTAIVNTGNGCCTLQTTATMIPPTCGLSNASVTVNISTAGVPPYSYSLDGSLFQAQNIFINVASATYHVVTLDSSSCSDTVTVTVPVSTNNLLVNITVGNISCFGANDGTATSGITGGNAPYNFVWSTGAATSSLSNLPAGNYSVSVTDPGGCSGSATTNITEPPVVMVNLGGDITICEGQLISLNAGSGFVTYQWSTNEVTPSIVPLASGDYTVTVTDINGCSATDVVNVNLVPPPTVDLEEDKFAYEGDHVGLFATINAGHANGGTYNWQPDTLLSCVTCQNTVALAIDTITYTLVYTDPIGCTSSGSITINVIPVIPVFWPNAFSPTGDGNNDIYLPYGSGVKQINWQIFNRWGEKVFESTNFNHGWDGMYKGQQLPMGVYVYQAKVILMNDEKKEYKGSVTLIR